ncbi:MAG: CRTAC1 family protein [Pyrinomonadaceae bacterium]
MGERYSLSATTLDYDRDGWPDIYVAVDSQASILYRNNRDGTFTDRGVESSVAFNESGTEQAGMGTAAADFDGDGYLDLAKTNFIDDLPNLYRNNGDGTFDEVTIASGLGKYREFMGWGVAFLDFDNDTWPDLFMVNGHIYPQLKNSSYAQRRILYRNLGNRKFKDVSSEAGADVTAEKSSRGLAIGDYDNDGDADLFISNMNEPPTILRNDGGNRQNFLSLKLLGRKANRSGIGARVTIVCGGRRLTDEVRSGSTFLSQSDLRLHFGLGAAAKIERIEIEWPGGSKETITDVGANQFVTVTEGAGITKRRLTGPAAE